MFALIGVLVFSEIYSYTSYEVVYEYSVDQDTSSWVTSIPELCYDEDTMEKFTHCDFMIYALSSIIWLLVVEDY